MDDGKCNGDRVRLNIAIAVADPGICGPGGRLPHY